MDIIQTWKTETLPPPFAQCRQTWKDNHPYATHRLLNDEYIWNWLAENRARYPSALQTGDAIRTVDMFRYCHLLARGGLIVDLDFYSLKPMDALLQRLDNQVVVGSMLMPMQEMEHSIPNAWMYAAAPKHPLWLVVLALAADRVADPYVERATGPILLWDAIHLYLSARDPDDLRSSLPGIAALADENCVQMQSALPDVIILPPDMLYPLSWGFSENYGIITDFRQSTVVSSQLIDKIALTPSTYAFTYWAHTWGEDDLLNGR